MFLTDSKVHEKPWTHQPTPEPTEPPKTVEEITEGRSILEQPTEPMDLVQLAFPEPTPKPKENGEAFKQLQETLKAGVQVVVANQLFPTPPDLAQRMVDEAQIEPGECVLEPSAGTGNLIAKGAMLMNPRQAVQYHRDEISLCGRSTLSLLRA